jgi:hypothetical protein
MYVMQDQSGSMSDTVSGGGTKWQALTSAFNTYVALPSAAGTEVGIQYFALADMGGTCPVSCTVDADCAACAGFCFGNTCFAGGGGDSCTAADYAKPDVEIAPLPGVAGAITTSLANHGPTTSTPTAPALQGAVDHAKAWAMAHTDRKVVAVFITDGVPTECNPMDQAGISAIAGAALAGTPSIETFAIGIFATADIPSGPDLLNAIAAAGGSKQAFNITTTTANVSKAIVAALTAIRGQAVGCQYLLPPSADPAKLNVQYQPGIGGAPIPLGNVADASHCTATGNAWYYDNNTTPTRIDLCAGVCNTVSADPTGAVDTLVGCPTQPAM